MRRPAGSASSPRFLTAVTAPQRDEEAGPTMADEIRDPVLRAAFVAAYEAWARKYPELLEDWPE